MSPTSTALLPPPPPTSSTLPSWSVLNFGMAYKQYTLLGYVEPSMYLVNIFQFIYVWDALYYEKAILTTMDITTDGFGFMLYVCETELLS